MDWTKDYRLSDLFRRKPGGEADAPPAPAPAAPENGRKAAAESI